MRRKNWFWARMIGWFVLLIWYIVYLINSIHAILGNTTIAVSHGITGVVGTILIVLGYFSLEKKERKGLDEK